MDYFLNIDTPVFIAMIEKTEIKLSFFPLWLLFIIEYTFCPYFWYILTPRLSGHSRESEL